MSAFDLFYVVRDKAYRVFHDYSVYSVEMFSGLTGDFVLHYQRGPVIHPSRALTNQGKAWWQRDFGGSTHQADWGAQHKLLPK